MPADDAIDRVAGDIADGQAIDWNALAQDAQTDEERARLECLRIVGAIAALHRSGNEPTAGDDAPTGPVIDVPQAPAEGAGEAWGRYRLLQEVGQGSFGSVYRAWDPELEREVAIKILHRDVADSRLRERLLREGRALARVRHANVVSVLGVESYGDRVGLCMEFVRGDTLEAVLRSYGTMSVREAVVIGQDVCRALAAVHRAGFVHRDVKARNIMRERAGRIVLMDFGTGRQVEPDVPAGRRRIAGTPVYMAPEVLAGQTASVCSDVYSVGVLLYYLVTATYPVEGQTMADIRTAHMEGRRASLGDRRPDLPLPFIKVVERALAPDPRQRCPSAGALLEALGTADGAGSETLSRTTYLRAALLGIAGLALGFVGLGVVSTRYFNLVLGRSDFADETVWDWLYWGVISSVGPAVLFMLALVALALLLVCRRLLRGVSATARNVERRLNDTAQRMNLSIVTSGALLVAVTALIAAWWYFLPLLVALVSIYPGISSAPVENLRFLAPEFSADHQSYRWWFSWATLLCIAVWYPVMRLGSRKGESLHRGMLLGGAAIVLLSLALLDFPYRLLYHSVFEAVTWRGEHCYILGERSDELLVFCPDMQPPRNRTVSAGAAGLERVGARENIFVRFSTRR